MKNGGFGAVRRDVVRLFEGRSVAGLTDGELLERFATSRDEAAFEALVARLGPMVLGVSRRMLADPHDVEDAFQATFLVLIRRAGSIRDRELVGPWLHGVATKVARRARAEAVRRSARERPAIVGEGREAAGSNDLELRALIDEEIERLPEPQRRAVVLCDVEGLTREEAAERLGWTLNMVRGRLERARGRLRGRLTRRGLAPSGGHLAWLGVAPRLSPGLVATTCRAALAFGAGRVGPALASASAVSLCEGVSQMMLLSKLKPVLAVVLSMGLVGGTGMLAAQGPGEKSDPSKSAAVPAPAPTPAPLPVVQEPAKAVETFQPRPPADLAKARIDAAQKRLEAQIAFYEEGRITIDRLIDASQGVMQARLDATDLKARRVEIVRSHYDLLKELLRREEASLIVGRATEADVTEARTKLLDAELALTREMQAPEAKSATLATGPATEPRPPASTARAKLAAERVEIARRMLANAEELHRNARISFTTYLDARKSWLEAEEAAATTKAERIRLAQEQIKHLNETLAVAEEMKNSARSTQSSVDQIHLKILDARIHLIDVSEAPEDPTHGAAASRPGASGQAAATDLERRISALERKVDLLLNRLDPAKR